MADEDAKGPFRLSCETPRATWHAPASVKGDFAGGPKLVVRTGDRGRQ